MYEVKMKCMNRLEDNLEFTCEKFGVNIEGYKFENVSIRDFIISDFEINTEDIASINIK